MTREYMEFSTWEAAEGPLLAQIAGPLWRLSVYRRSLHAIDTSWQDVVRLNARTIMRPVAAQLYRSLGSIAANVAEGYSRSSGPDRVRLLEYALGSARESIVWYRAARPLLADGIYEHRVDGLAQICKLLSTMIPEERTRTIRRSLGSATGSRRAAGQRTSSADRPPLD